MGRDLARHLNVDFMRAVGLANVVGWGVVTVFLALVIPSPRGTDLHDALLVNAIVLAYALVALPIGITRGRNAAAPIVRWLEQERAPTDDERAWTLGFPMLGFRVIGPLWAGGALLSGGVSAVVANAAYGTMVGLTVALGGLTTCTLIVVWAERRLRDILALALRSGVPEDPVGPGIRARLSGIWAVSTGVPLVGILLLGAVVLLGTDMSTDRLAVTALFLAALGIAVGLTATSTAGRGIAEPVDAVRRQLARVEQGELDAADVEVDQGNEIGLLAAGFNQMVGGLRERERLREAFGAFVDPELAERVLREGTDLAGEEVTVSILFLDVRGFTAMAETSTPTEVVAALNELYDVVVPIVLGHGGHANKFIGDGMLAIFGAPERHPDHADRAVAAALAIAHAVNHTPAGGLRVGVGVNSGTVLVGTIGGGGRLDFTVIGDAVNTAARVEATTRSTGDDVLITEATHARLTRDHGGFEGRPPVPLKGKSQPVGLLAPRQR